MGVYNITWIPPEPRNGSFYQILEYSYFSAYTIGPVYNSYFSSAELIETQNEFTFTAFCYTNYNFTITTYNIKYNISNGPAVMLDQSSPEGMKNLFWFCFNYCVMCISVFNSAYSCS